MGVFYKEGGTGENILSLVMDHLISNGKGHEAVPAIKNGIPAKLIETHTFLKVT